MSVDCQCRWAVSAGGLSVPVGCQCQWAVSAGGLSVLVGCQCRWAVSAGGLSVSVAEAVVVRRLFNSRDDLQCTAAFGQRTRVFGGVMNTEQKLQTYTFPLSLESHGHSVESVTVFFGLPGRSCGRRQGR